MLRGSTRALPCGAEAEGPPEGEAGRGPQREPGAGPQPIDDELEQVLHQAREYMVRLRRDNTSLRALVAYLESRVRSGGGTGEELAERLKGLEGRLAETEAARQKLEAENKELAAEYVRVEEQDSNLANLYVASRQLHSTLDYAEAVRTVQDIVINLIGAEVFHLFMANDKTGLLEVEASEGQEPSRRGIVPGEGVIGRAVQTGWAHFAANVDCQKATPFEEPIAVIPLRIKSSVIGAISINKLLVQKKVFTATDHELFTLLAGHAATALLAARLYSTSQRKLNTLQGFVDILKVQTAE